MKKMKQESQNQNNEEEITFEFLETQADSFIQECEKIEQSLGEKSD